MSDYEPTLKNKEHTLQQIETLKKIMVLDVQKQGKIFKSECPHHKKTTLSYGWSNREGARIRCEICGWTTHFEPTNFQAVPVDPLETHRRQFYEQARQSSFRYQNDRLDVP